MKIKHVALSVALALTLSACGGSSSNNKKEVIDPPVVVEPQGEFLALDSAVEHVTLTESKVYYVDLAEDQPSLTVSLVPGLAGEAMGDPDLYIAYDRVPTAGENGNFDCVSFSGADYNELCVLENVKAGRYYILVDVFENSQVTDATLWASSNLFKSVKSCQEPVSVRAQAMTEEQLNSACNILDNTKVKFDETLNAGIAPEFGLPVPNDLNETTQVNIFSSLANHSAWMKYLYNSNNSSGIYYETEPTEWFHKSEINTFDSLEWNSNLHNIRSLSHEYVHALDGRYNREGAYKYELSWWAEGLAEYIGTYHNLPYQRFEISLDNETPTLAEIFSSHLNDGVPSPYRWGQMAVAFLIEQQPAITTELLTMMRAGQWDEFSAKLDVIAAELQGDFETYVQQTAKENFVASAADLALDTAQPVSGRGGWLYKVNLVEDAESMTFKVSGGSGDVDLLVGHSQVPHWVDPASYHCYSYNADTNNEECTLEMASAGDYYVLVDSYWENQDIVDAYLSVCTGTDCQVALPEPMTQIVADEVEVPVVQALPEPGQVGECTLATSYTRSADKAIDFSVTNESEQSVSLYWIDFSSGQPYLESSYGTLAPGEVYTADFWVQGDRMMITDANNECLGVVVLNDTNNMFTYK